MPSRWIRLVVLCLVAALVTVSSGGCQIFGAVASKIPRSRDAQYKNLAGQRVGVLAWTHRGIRIDYPNLQIDMANAIQAQLQAKTDESSLEETTFPWEPRSVLRFMREHPELEAQGVTEWAPRVSGIDRLIYIEIVDFSTRSGSAVQLLRGGITVNVKVVEIQNRAATIGYERQHMRLYFPPNAPEGVVNVSEAAIYNGTVTVASREIGRLFYPHVIED